MKMNKRIKKWTRKNFKLSAPKSVDLSSKVKRFKSEIVSTVHEGSPAHFLGIKPGWILVSINGKAYDQNSIFLKKFPTKRYIRYKFEFYDPQEKQRYRLKGKKWPFGIVLITSPARVSEKLTKGIRGAWSDIHSLWELGLINELGEIYSTLETTCARYAEMDKPSSFPPKNEPFPPVVHFDATSALSIAAFAAGHIERAKYIFRLTEVRIREHLNQGGGISNFTVSMHYYTGSLLSDLTGEHEDAIRYARRAYKRAPNNLEVQRHLQSLTGETHAPVKSEFDVSVNMQYALPNIDPVRELPSTGKTISFQRSLEELGSDQLLLVLVMGHYRSNGYYTEDILAAAPIFKAFAKKVKAVHVICEGDFSRDAGDRRAYEKLALAFKMPIHILLDTDKTVSKRINATGYPSRFFFNKNGEVLSDKRLWDETAIWEAFRNS